MFYRILFLLVVFVLTNAEYVSYKAFKVYNVIPINEKEVKLLTDLSQNGHYSFWTDRIQENYEVKIMVKPEKQWEFEYLLKSEGVYINMVIDDVQK